MDYASSVKLLSCQGKFRIELGLKRISKILDLLGNPQDELKYIHVAGTNGKGSVCSVIATILQEAGLKVGLYTSPHIFDYTERIKISGNEISKNDFAEYIEKICNLADEHNIDLTEFEILTAVMFDYFNKQKVEVVVLETGLGGRFDATNVIKTNLCSIITHIDFDHTERLGNSLDKIAFEKAGIIKENCPVFVSEGYEVFKDAADDKNALFVIVPPFEDVTNLSLKGVFQQQNLSLALAAVRFVFPKISENIIQAALKKVKHPYRFQYLKDKNMIVDSAHNPNGAIALRQSLDYYYPDIPRRFIFGCLRNKDFKAMIKSLFQEQDEIYFYHFNYPNSASVEELKTACPYPSEEFKRNLFVSDNSKLTIVCGSFYMLKEVLTILGISHHFFD